MELSRSAKSEQIEKRSSPTHQREDSIQKTNKNMVRVNNQRNQLSPMPQQFNTVNLHAKPNKTMEEKSMLFQEIRIKGQQKLIYVKQCRLKKWQSEQIFKNYPFCNMEIFTFNDELLKDQNGKFTANIIQDENGIHLIQQYSQNLSKSKYITLNESQQDKFNGQSVSIFHDGMIFQGNYHDGKICGMGYQLHPNGNTFIGSFKEGVKNGEGSYYWFSNNQIYSGDWMGGLPHGYGVYISKDRYEGCFSNGLKFGFGQQMFGNGDKYVGQYVNSVAEGYGEYYWADGSYYKGDFKQGVRHGYGIWQDQKQVYKGSYRMDKKQGFGIYKWINKQIYKGQFRDDYRQGYGQFYQLGKQGKQKLLYKGSWMKGKKNEEGKVDQAKIKMLYSFLDESYRLDMQIQQQSKKQPKKKVGHQHCIPNDPIYHSTSHRHK